MAESNGDDWLKQFDLLSQLSMNTIYFMGITNEITSIATNREYI